MTALVPPATQGDVHPGLQAKAEPGRPDSGCLVREVGGGGAGRVGRRGWEQTLADLELHAKHRN